jgi:hypothetical protein
MLVPAQIVVVPATLTLTGKFGFTVIVKVFEVAGFPVGQLTLEVSTQVTWSEFVNPAVEYVVLFVPTFPPFTFHWYAGVLPPLVGVAVKVTFVPAQIVVLPATVTLTGKFGFTVAVTAVVSVHPVAGRVPTI